MKKILVVVLSLMLSTSIVFADTKQDIQSLSNRIYMLEKELLNNCHDNKKALTDIEYIRSITSSLLNTMASEYKMENDVKKRAEIGNALVALILYQLALDHAEEYIKYESLDSLSNMISKTSLADLIVNSLK